MNLRSEPASLEPPILFSIVIPAYNLEHYIVHTLRSVSATVDRQCEVIVVDDGSTDDTRTQIDEFAGDHPEIRFRLIAQSNHGVSSARNSGLRAARGLYIVFLDGDDIVSSRLVPAVREVLSHGALPDMLCWSFVVCPSQELAERDARNSQDWPNPTRSISGVEAIRSVILEREFSICIGSAAYRSEFLKNLRIEFTEDCRVGEDREFIYKALCHAEHVTVVGENLSYYVNRAGSVTNSGSVSKFDAVYANVRAARYLQQVGGEINWKAAFTLLTEHALVSYFRGLDHCLRRTDYVRVSDVLWEMRSKYPTLNSDLRRLVWIRLVHSTHRPTISHLLILVTPTLQAHLMSFYRRAIRSRAPFRRHSYSEEGTSTR